MEPLKEEVEAAWAVLTTPLESFVTEKEVAEKAAKVGLEKANSWGESLAQTRMVKAVIKAVDRLRGQRSLHLVAIRFSPSWIHCFGPYPTVATAEKARKEIVATLGNLVMGHGIVGLTGPSGWQAWNERADAPIEAKGGFAEAALDAAAFKNGWNGKAATRHQYLKESA